VSVWADASVLIALDAIGEVEFLRRAVGKVCITRQVAEEVLTDRASEALRGAAGTWLQVLPVQGDVRRFRRLGLGHGEASMFLTPRGDTLILDDHAARRLAEAEGRPYTGLLGVLLEAARTGVIPRAQARSMLARLARVRFRMASDLYERLREELGEAPEKKPPR